ncbi:hypothetical protein E4T39_01735 [Aureobasidium subglaciale]|nr:hypothetical protein E4T39_01735 [Aureobasidium subglaciale]
MIKDDEKLSRRIQRSPPCIQPLEDLDKVPLPQIRRNNFHDGVFLIVRTISDPLQPGPLLPIINVIEDENFHIMHIDVYFPSTITSTAILANGIFLAIKTPTCKRGNHGPCIKVFHPSDVMIVGQDHKLMPVAFRTMTGSHRRSIWDWKEEAETASSRGAYSKAIDSCSNAINLAVANAREHSQLSTLHHARSVAAKHAGHHQLAFEDATISIRSCSDDDLRKAGRELMLQLIATAYQEQKYFVGDMIIIRANNDIPEGTELTTSYLPIIVAEPDRHAELLKSRGFECVCPLCEREKHCRDDLKLLFDEVKKTCPARSIDPHMAIKEVHKLVEKLEKVYFDPRFDNLPRIGMQDPQASLLDLWIQLEDRAKIRKHATAVLRERGYWIVATNGGDGKLQLEGGCGMPHRTVVRALHSLARFPRTGGRHEEAREYLELAEQMWNVFNDTSCTWAEELEILDEIM